MTILDDARPGMDDSVRPQDDLFGHVNGRWLAETEIPSDRSSWGGFAMLAEEVGMDFLLLPEHHFDPNAAARFWGDARGLIDRALAKVAT